MTFRGIPMAALLVAASLLPLQASPAPQKRAPKVAKPATPAPATQPPAPQAESGGTPLAQAQVVRAATCTLTLKGRIERQAQVEAKESKAKRSKRILEDFSYTLPGQLTETLHPNGETEFTFTPSESLGTAGAQGRLHLEDDFPAPGWAPIALDATSLQNAGAMVFKSLARGQKIVPLGGAVVNLKGRLSSLAPMTVTNALGETENRPVASTPIPKVGGDLNKPSLPVLNFQGPSLWAWINAPGGCLLRGTIAYTNLRMNNTTLNGGIEFTFQIGAIQTPPK